LMERKNIMIQELSKTGLEDDELYAPKDLCIQSNKLFVLDIKRVLIYSDFNEYEKTFITNDLWGKQIFVNNNGEIMIFGNKDDSDKIIHIYNENGEYLRSFGDCLDWLESSQLEKFLQRYKGQGYTGCNIPLIIPPYCHYSNEKDSTYMISHVDSSLVIYEGEVFNKKNDVSISFEGPHVITTSCRPNSKEKGYSYGYIGRFPSLFTIDHYLVLFRAMRNTPDFKNSDLEVCVYKNGDFHNEFVLKGIRIPPSVMDSEGYIYCIETDKILKYKLPMSDLLSGQN